MTLTAFSIQNSSADSDGGMMFLNNSGQSLVMTNSNLNSSSSQASGGVFNIIAGASITLATCTFSDFQSTQHGRFMNSLGSSVTLSVSASSFACSLVLMDYTADVAPLLLQLPPLSNSAGAFFVQAAISVTSSNNTFLNCYFADQGSAFSLI